MVRSATTALTMCLLLLLAVPASAAEEAKTSKVTFIHGIRGFVADVYLDGELLLEGFAPERVTSPLDLEVGEHTIDLREADAPADAEPAVSKTFDVTPGGKVTAIAHWTGIEDCKITLFDDAASSLARGKGKVIARHAAATGSVKFSLDNMGEPSQLPPDSEVSASVKPGEHTVSISGERGLAESSTVPVDEGSARVVYLVGNAKDDTFGLLTQTVDGLESNPAGVPTGNSGLAATDGGGMAVVPAALLFVLGAVLLGSLRRGTVSARG